MSHLRLGRKSHLFPNKDRGRKKKVVSSGSGPFHRWLSKLPLSSLFQSIFHLRFPLRSKASYCFPHHWVLRTGPCKALYWACSLFFFIETTFFLNKSPTSIAILLLSRVLASLLKLFLNYRLTLPAVKDQEMALPVGAPCPTGTFLMTPTVVYLRLDRFSSCCSTSSVWPDFDRFLIAGQWKPRILSPILCWLVAPQGLLFALCFSVGWGRIRLDCLWAAKPTIEGGLRSDGSIQERESFCNLIKSVLKQSLFQTKKKRFNAWTVSPYS